MIERNPPADGRGQSIENAISEITDAMRATMRTEERCAQIVREEWHRAVKEFGLQPGSPTEAVVARIQDRIYGITRGLG